MTQPKDDYKWGLGAQDIQVKDDYKHLELKRNIFT